MAKQKFLEEKALDRAKVMLLDQKEIRSHSSVLTNLRLDLVFRRIDAYKESCWTNPVFDNIKAYFSALYTAYDITFSVFSAEENGQIVELFQHYYRDFFSLMTEENRNIKTGFKMLIILDQINRLIKADLQKKQYFFKLGTVDIKGIEKSIMVIQRGGGFFGAGKKKPRQEEPNKEIPKVPQQ